MLKESFLSAKSSSFELSQAMANPRSYGATLMVTSTNSMSFLHPEPTILLERSSRRACSVPCTNANISEVLITPKTLISKNSSGSKQNLHLELLCAVFAY